MVKEIDEEEFKNNLNGDGVILLEFFAKWCGPCQLLGPILEQISSEFELNVYKLNVDKYQAVAKTYGVHSIPTVCVFKDGKYIDKFIGSKPLHEIKAILEKYI